MPGGLSHDIGPVQVIVVLLGLVAAVLALRQLPPKARIATVAVLVVAGGVALLVTMQNENERDAADYVDCVMVNESPELCEQ